jgi:hypothetical protein
VAKMGDVGVNAEHERPRMYDRMNTDFQTASETP